MGFFRTCGVVVVRSEEDGCDEMGEPVRRFVPERVEGVLPQPGGTSDLDASRPDGVSVDMTFHFPKGYGKSLRGCAIEFGGRSYRVVGDPVPYAEGNVPGPFSMAVEAVMVDG